MPNKRKRRQHGEGSISKRSDGRYQVQITPPNGIRVTKYAKTAKEATDTLKNMQRQAEEDRYLLSQGQTFGDFLTTWFESRRVKLRAHTEINWEGVLRNHIIPNLGVIPLDKLTAQDIQKYYAARIKDGLESSTVYDHHIIIRAALNSALKLEMVRRNVASMVDSPPRRTEEERDPLNSEETQKLLAEIKGDRLEAVYIMALTTGMREGEIVGLRWRDVDFNQKTVQVKRTMYKLKGEYQTNAPKSKAGIRRIILTQTAINALYQHKERQQQEKDEVGEAWDTTADLVFCNQIGGPLYPQLLIRGVRRFLRSAGVSVMRQNEKEFSFHDLRHTGATLLMEAGVHPKVVSELLGHSSVATTMMMYQHVTPRMLQTAADTMDTILAATTQSEHDRMTALEEENRELRLQISKLSNLLSKYLGADKNKDEENV